MPKRPSKKAPKGSKSDPGGLFQAQHAVLRLDGYGFDLIAFTDGEFVFLLEVVPAQNFCKNL